MQIEAWKLGKKWIDERVHKLRAEEATQRRMADALLYGDEDVAEETMHDAEKTHKKAGERARAAQMAKKRLYKSGSTAVPLTCGSVQLSVVEALPSLDDAHGLFVVRADDCVRTVVLVGAFEIESDSPDELVTRLDVAYEVRPPTAGQHHMHACALSFSPSRYPSTASPVFRIVAPYRRVCGRLLHIR